jgi:hypothetical protein
MIPVANPIPEPADFDAECRQKGKTWLAAQRLAGKRPKTSNYPNYWATYENDLATAFQQRCGWWAMWIAEGAVEHFLSKKNRPDLAYEWSNYRYIAGSVNGSKGTHDDKVLDPFEVQSGWFEVLLPSMQLVVTTLLPTHFSARAEFTLKQLKLRNGTKVVRSRKHWYDQFKKGMLDLDGLRTHAPLVADAVLKLQTANQPLP